MNKTNKLLEQILESENLILEDSREEIVLAVLSGSSNPLYSRHNDFIAKKESGYLERGFSEVESVRKAQKDWLSYFLNGEKEIQEEGILDRLAVRTKTLGNRTASKIAQATTSDPAKKKEFQDNFNQEIGKQMGKIVWAKMKKVLTKGIQDMVVLLKNQDPQSSQIFQTFLNDPKLMDDMIELLDSEFDKKFISMLSPPELPKDSNQ